MSELGDLLELLHGASGRYRTVRLEAREWRHNHRLIEAYDRLVREARGSGGQIVLGDPGEAPAETEVELRIWFEAPNRVREERLEAGRLCTAVANGMRWWTSMPEWATVVEEGDGWARGAVAQTARVLLDPGLLLGSVELALRGRSEAAGREAIAVSATPRPGAQHVGPELLSQGATRHELLVDAERGVLLSVTAFLDQAAFSTIEVRESVFDAPIDASVFSYEAAEGEEILRPQDVSPGEPVTIEEAVRRASFTVLVPRSLGRGWRMHVLSTPGRDRPPLRETVHVSLFREDATHSVSIRQTAPPFERWQRNGTDRIERDGRELWVADTGWHRVLLEREGTCVELGSQTIEAEELVELALALEPAPTERPPLLG
jgi:outer membrane lipoprotein-sorting protein